MKPSIRSRRPAESANWVPRASVGCSVTLIRLQGRLGRRMEGIMGCQQPHFAGLQPFITEKNCLQSLQGVKDNVSTH